MIEWQPMESAPHDVPILGWDGYDMTSIVWRLDSWLLVEAGAYAEDPRFWPKYWMPLPDPPKEVR